MTPEERQRVAERILNSIRDKHDLLSERDVALMCSVIQDAEALARAVVEEA